MNTQRTYAQLGAVVLTAILWTPAAVGDWTFYPSDDSFVRYSQPSVNYGYLNRMYVANGCGHPSHPPPPYFQQDTLIRFDLSSIPSGTEVTSATLHLYFYDHWDTWPGGRELTGYRITEDWDEDTVTAGTCPEHASGVTSGSIVPPTYGWMTWDVTSDVQAFVDGSEINYGWTILDEQDWCDFDIPVPLFRSKEYGSFTPYLYVGTEPDDGLVAYWSFDEGSGSVAHDTSGYDNHGAVYGADWATGISGSALDITGTDIVRFIPSSVDDPVATALTIAGWVYLHGDSGNYGFVFDGRTHATAGFSLYVRQSGTIVFQLLTPGFHLELASLSTVSPGRWTHVAAVCDYPAQTARIYMDGEEVEGSPFTPPSAYYDTYLSPAIGNNRWAPGDGQWRPLNGILDELRIYNRALTAAEVWDLYQQYAQDCNSNGIPDECDIDCGASGGLCDILGCGQSDDCQPNGIPDECDLAVPTVVVTEDDFDDGVLHPDWEVTFEEATGWEYAEAGTELTVTDIYPSSEPDPYTVALARLVRSCWAPGDFRVDFDFSWDSEGSARAMQGVYVYLYAGNGDLVACVGYNDPWVHWRGAKYARMGDTTWHSGQNTLPFAGSASGSIDRTGDAITVFWDGDPVLNGICDLPVEKVELRFRYVAYDGSGGPSFFGNESVDLFRLMAPSADCNGNGVPDECDVAEGTSADLNTNGIPDDCEPRLDIKPGSCPNPFNPSSHGVLPVAVLGRAHFDATTIDVSSVRLSRADGVGGAVVPNEGPPGPHSVIDDVSTPFDGELCDCHELTGDGIDDLMMHFKTDDVVEALLLDDLPAGSLVELVVSGYLLDGTPFEASDCVRLVPPGTAGALLAVESSVPGGWIGVDPLDETLDGGGFADFERTFPSTTVVTLTAEEWAQGRPLRGWQIGGLLHHMGQTSFEVAIDQDMTARAVYGPTPGGGSPKPPGEMTPGEMTPDEMAPESFIQEETAEAGTIDRR